MLLQLATFEPGVVPGRSIWEIPAIRIPIIRRGEHTDSMTRPVISRYMLPMTTIASVMRCKELVYAWVKKNF